MYPEVPPMVAAKYAMQRVNMTLCILHAQAVTNNYTLNIHIYTSGCNYVVIQSKSHVAIATCFPLGYCLPHYN